MSGDAGNVSGEEDQSEVQEFGNVLGTLIEGSLPLVVGGHAVNLWALVFKEQIGAELQANELLPLTSKDLDLYGSGGLLAKLAEKFKVRPVINREIRSPVIGLIYVNIAGKERKIEVLRDVRGVSAVELSKDWLQVQFDEYDARVPLPTVLLKGKMANVVQINQSDRNDVKHVKILLLVAREYLSQVVDHVESGKLEPRIGIKALEDVLAVTRTEDALKCNRTYGIDLRSAWPRDVLAKAKNEKIRNFVKFRLPD